MDQELSNPTGLAPPDSSVSGPTDAGTPAAPALQAAPTPSIHEETPDAALPVEAASAGEEETSEFAASSQPAEVLSASAEEPTAGPVMASEPVFTADAAPISSEEIGPEAAPEATEAPEGSGEAVPPSSDQAVTAPFPDDADTPQDTAPNWMLAFVCGWAGGTAVYELWDVLHRTDLTPVLHLFAVAGYSTLGAGLFLSALEALLWGRLEGKRGAQAALLFASFFLLLVGVAFLFQFHDPDPNRGRI